MTTYSIERKECILNKLLPPENMTVIEVAKEESISKATLYNWLTKARQSGVVIPIKKSQSENWSAETKLAIIIATASLSESELSQYCREKGIYIEQVKQWKSNCLLGFNQSEKHQKVTDKQTRLDKTEIKLLKKELRRKEKALAETAALLVLRKKLHTFWEESNEVD